MFWHVGLKKYDLDLKDTRGIFYARKEVVNFVIIRLKIKQVIFFFQCKNMKKSMKHFEGRFQKLKMRILV